MSEKTRAKFWSRVDTGGECWLWKGPLQKHGYGAIGGRLAHRVAYELLKGPIPEGLQLDHLCRVRPCVNPEHLEPVTPKTNCLRGFGPGGLNAQKTHCPRGHEYSDANTYVRTGRLPARGCRACNRIAQAAYVARKFA